MAPQIKCKTSNHLLNLTQTQQTLNIGFFGDLLQFSSRGLTSWKYLQYLPLQSPFPSPNAQLTQGHRKNSLCGCYDIICLHENSSQPCSFKKKKLPFLLAVTKFKCLSLSVSLLLPSKMRGIPQSQPTVFQGSRLKEKVPFYTKNPHNPAP